MTFQNVDQLLDFFDRFAEDQLREYATAITLAADELDDDVGDLIDAARESQAETMAQWRATMRREFASWPLTFPVTVHWHDQRADTGPQQGSTTRARGESR